MTPKEDKRLSEQKTEITGVFLIAVAILATVSVFFNNSGFFSEIVSYGLIALFGRGGVFLPILILLFWGVMLITATKIKYIHRRYTALGILSFTLLALIHLVSGSELTVVEMSGNGGGIIGSFLISQMISLFGWIGTIVFLLTLLVVSFILALDKPLRLFVKSHLNKSEAFSISPEETTENSSNAIEPHHDLPVPPNFQAEEKAIAPPPVPRHANPETQSRVLSALQEMISEKNKEKAISRTRNVTEDEVKPKAAPTESFVAAKRNISDGTYHLPELSLLGEKSKLKKGGRGEDQSRQLEEVLASFGVKAQVIEVEHGPVVTRYVLQPAPGVKVNRIVNLTNDLTLSLAAKGLRLEAPIPGRAAVGIEVPNKESQIVSFRDTIDSKSFFTSNKLTVALGMDIGGNVVTADLGKMPHLLVAGATGSGKSVCINTLIMSILYKAFPNEVKFIMIDPKMVELSMYNGIPHLMAPVVTAAKKASGVLHMVVDEMERRYKLFAEARVRDLANYNELLKRRGEEALPFIVVIIDELADMMMVAPVEVEDSICRIAQMARATGIHLVIATQRPSVDVITGLIKANVPSRIAFAVSSQIDSRTILDSVGAERLLGRGDMLYSPVGSMKPTRVQGALVTEKEIELVIEHWKSQGEPEYQEKFVNIPERAEMVMDEDADDLFWDAVKVVVDNGQASASMLQRRLRVGYSRAGRLIDMMEAKGIVGQYEGSKPREVYITARQMEEMKSKSEEKL